MREKINYRIKRWKGEDRADFEESLLNKNVSFFDDKKYLDSELSEKAAGRQIHFLFKKKSPQEKSEGQSANTAPGLTYYESLEEISRLAGEVCFLSGRSLRSLLAKYPYRAQYVACEITINPNWIFGIPGLIRRLNIGSKRRNSKILCKGIVATEKNNRKRYWLLIQNANAIVPTHFSLDENIGIEGLLDFLNREKINYVVLRFFEKLPQKYRPGGDLDILVDDDQWNTVKDFLLTNPGREMVDMYGVSTPASGARLPYYPPYLARRILDNKIQGPGGAFVPCPMDYLNSLIYHCLYHKGLSSGIKTNFKYLTPSPNPDNDYAEIIRKLLKGQNLDIEVGLEELHAYMSEVGWLPHLDTLRFIAMTNEWLENLLKKTTVESDIGLNVCVAKRGLVKKNEFNKLCESFQAKGFHIIKREVFSDERADLAYKFLRGGNWSTNKEGDYLPAAGLVLLDVQGIVLKARSKGVNINRIRSVKSQLRDEFDTAGESLIHITDHTSEALEYLEVLYPEEWKEIYAGAKDKAYSNDDIQLGHQANVFLAFMKVYQLGQKGVAFLKRVILKLAN